MRRTDTPPAVTTEPSSPAIESRPQPAERQLPLYRPGVVAMVGWFVGWPVVLFVSLPLMTPGDTLECCLLGVGCWLWLSSCYGVYLILFTIAEARWPAARTIRNVLSWLFSIARAFQGHHHHSD
jgi:hypothetical protein